MSHLYRDGQQGACWRRVAAAVATLALAGAIATIAPGGVRGVTGLFQAAGNASAPTGPTSPPTSLPPTGLSDTTAPLVASEAPIPAPAAGPTVGTDVVPGTPTSVPVTAAEAAVAVETLQTVPAMRDVVVDIDGTQLATDASGRIAVPPELRNGTIEVVGFVAEPVVQHVEFDRWSDGDVEPRRPLSTLTGPVAQIGLTVHSSVLVQALTPSFDATVRFASSGGAIDLATSTPTWVVATRVVPVDGGLVAEPLVYEAQSIVDGDRTVALEPQAFFPTPEALWKVQI